MGRTRPSAAGGLVAARLASGSRRSMTGRLLSPSWIASPNLLGHSSGTLIRQWSYFRCFGSSAFGFASKGTAFLSSRHNVFKFGMWFRSDGMVIRMPSWIQEWEPTESVYYFHGTSVSSLPGFRKDDILPTFPRFNSAGWRAGGRVHNRQYPSIERQ